MAHVGCMMAGEVGRPVVDLILTTSHAVGADPPASAGCAGMSLDMCDELVSREPCLVRPPAALPTTLGRFVAALKFLVRLRLLFLDNAVMNMECDAPVHVLGPAAMSENGVGPANATPTCINSRILDSGFRGWETRLGSTGHDERPA